MKRITFFADFGSPHRPYTGGYYFAEKLFHILKQLPVELTVYALRAPVDKGESYCKDSSVRFISLPDANLGRPLSGILWALKLRRALRKMPRQDLYIFDKPSTYLPFLPKAPALAMFHGSDFVKWENLTLRHPRTFLYGLLWRKPFINAVERSFLKKSAGTPLFNSRDTLNILSWDFGIPKGDLERYVIHLPVDTHEAHFDMHAREEIRAKHGIAADEIVIISLSNISLVKGHSRLASIINQSRERFKNKKIRFLLVGGPTDQMHSIDSFFTDPAIKTICVRAGEVPHEDVYKYYSAADIALSTSLRESFGYFIAEGMSVGLPFVAYRGGAIEEVIVDEKTGYVVGHESEFMERLAHLVEDKKARTAMGEVGRLHIEKSFGMNVFAERLKKILRDEFSIL